MFVRPSGVYLAIGDDRTATVLACLGPKLSEKDSIVKAVFDSVKFD